MPQAQVIDLNPAPRTELTPLEKTLSAFSQEQGKIREQNRESDALKQIYQQYQGDAENIRGKIEAISSDPRLSPTTRVNTVNALLNIEKYNAQRMKVTEKTIKEQEKAKEKSENEQALRNAGATQQQIDLFNAAPIGGQSEIIKTVNENIQRKIPPAGLVPEGREDFDANLTPKERVHRQDDRFRLQAPLVDANNKAIAASESEGQSIDLLKELDKDGKVGTGLHRLNINPKTGDLLLPAAASPEEQLFVKTVNDFTVKAKDSFGSRVTNFELDRFMQRLPTLANSVEGRALIMRQMGIINQINQLERKAIRNVFDEYGVRNIDYADAETRARKSIEPQKEALRKEFLSVETLSKQQDSEFIKQYKARCPPGYTPVRTPGGQMKAMPNKNLESALDKGYTKL